MEEDAEVGSKAQESKETQTQKQVEFIQGAFSKGLPLRLYGGYAEEAFLEGGVTRKHHDVDMVALRKDGEELRLGLENLGCNVSEQTEKGSDKPYKFLVKKGDVEADVALLDWDEKRGQAYAETATPDGKKVRVYFDRGALNQEAQKLDGTEVQTVSPLMQMQMREAFWLAKRGEPRQQDLDKQEALRQKFFPNEESGSSKFKPELVETTENKIIPNSPTLFETAEKIADSPTPLITDKDTVPPSGDKRDYVSLSPYWHRDKDGELVYIDGKVNSKVNNYPDSDNLGKAAGNILITSIAARFAEDPAEKQKFANYATSTIRAWFVDDKTRMTPSFEYAQMKQGETTGDFYGMIEGNRLMYVIEGVNFLKGSGLLDAETLKGVETWTGQYLNWLLTSEKAIGKKDAENEKERNGEKGMPNNHGTFYDVQVAYLADFLGRPDLAKETLARAKERIKSQINPNGEMPLEAARAAPYDYQLYNLYALSQLALLGQKHYTDLWNWETEDGRGLRKAFEYFVGQLRNAGDKPFKMNRASEFYLTFRAASIAYNNPDYWDLPKTFYKDPLVDEATRVMFRQEEKQ